MFNSPVLSISLLSFQSVLSPDSLRVNELTLPRLDVPIESPQKMSISFCKLTLKITIVLTSNSLFMMLITSAEKHKYNGTLDYCLAALPLHLVNQNSESIQKCSNNFQHMLFTLEYWCYMYLYKLGIS